MRWRVMVLIGMLLCAWPVADMHAAQNTYPAKPIQFIIGFGSGTAADFYSRLMCNEASPVLGQSFVPMNKPGGSGALAYSELARAKPDGYTIGVITISLILNEKMGTIPFGLNAFEPIIGVSADPAVVCVPADSPYTTIKELLDAARQQPGKITIGVSPPGSSGDISASLIELSGKVQFRKVAHQDAMAQVTTAVAGGHLDAGVTNATPALAMVRAGKVKVIGVLHSQRLDLFPDVQTFAEAGYPIKAATFRILVAPKGTPKPVIDTLYKAFKQARESDKFKEFVTANSGITLDLDPAQCVEYYNATDKELAPVLKMLGMSKEPEKKD